jgi:hypothetical protein
MQFWFSTKTWSWQALGLVVLLRWMGLLFKRGIQPSLQGVASLQDPPPHRRLSYRCWYRESMLPLPYRRFRGAAGPNHSDNASRDPVQTGSSPASQPLGMNNRVRQRWMQGALAYVQHEVSEEFQVLLAPVTGLGLPSRFPRHAYATGCSHARYPFSTLDRACQTTAEPAVDHS